MAAEQVASQRASSLSLSPSQQVGGTLSPAVTWAITTIIVSGIAYYHWRYEGWFETIAFAGSVTAALFFALLIASRRILFSIVLIALLVTTIVIAADVKRHYI